MKVEIINPNKPGKNKEPQNDRALLRYLKFMFWMGYLPINWINPEEPDCQDVLFEVSFSKSSIIFILDFLISTIIVPYFYIWHRLNMKKDFDLNQLLDPNYYVMVFGSMTSAICQLTFVISPVSFCWIFVVIGKI